MFFTRYSMKNTDNKTHNNIEQTLADIDWEACQKRTPFTPSPAAREDQVIYFLMLDRFSDEQEKGYNDNNGNYSTGPAQMGSEIKVEARNGKAIRLTVPAVGFVIHE